MDPIFKFPILLILALIVLSLASGMFFLSRDDGKGNRVVTSLTFRVILSLMLFVMLILGYFFGQVEPNQNVPNAKPPQVEAPAAKP